MVVTQKIRVGLPHAGSVVTVIVETDHFRVLAGGGEELVVACRRTTRR
jgi:hypothetical protein